MRITRHKVSDFDMRLLLHNYHRNLVGDKDLEYLLDLGFDGIVDFLHIDNEEEHVFTGEVGLEVEGLVDVELVFEEVLEALVLLHLFDGDKEDPILKQLLRRKAPS